MKSVALIVIVGLLALGGCKRGAQTKEAIQAAIVDYLAKRGNLNLASMQIDVVSVTFRENEADATVSFRAKGADASGPGMTMSYTLVRQSGGWAVKPRGDSGSPAHAMGGAAPEGAPAGHPPVGAPPPAETKK